MEKVFIKNRKGLKMALRVSVDDKNSKLAFLVHGLASRNNYPHMLVLEEAFIKNGYNVINIDVTDSLNESESSAEGITFSRFIEDLEDTISWAKTQSFYREPFALGGQSLGAQAIIWFAGHYPGKVELLIPLSFCWLDGKEQVKRDNNAKVIFEMGYIERVSKSTGRSLRIYRNYPDDMENYNFYEIVENITARTFLISGSKDTEYRLVETEKLFNLLTCEKQLVILDDVPHDLANTEEHKQKLNKALETLFISVK